MDDVIILAKDKETLHSWKAQIEAFLNDELHLDLNDKTCIRPVRQGIEFVGVRIYATHMKLRKSTTGRLNLIYFDTMKKNGKLIQPDAGIWKENHNAKAQKLA